MNKTVLIGAGVLLVVVGGGIFLYLLGASSPEEEHTTTPTRWSQEGDYKIEETPQGTLVNNTAAGFSFKIPEGWRVEPKEGYDEFWLSLLSQDAEFDQNGVFIGGCGVNVETVDHSIEVEAVKASILSGGFENQEVIDIDGHKALQTTNTPTDAEILQRVGTTIKIDLPIDDTYLTTILTQLLPRSGERCGDVFESFLSEFLIE